MPDDPNQSTSDHGYALTDPAVLNKLTPIVDEVRALGTRVSLFIDPDPAAADAAPATGAQRIELYTESYATAFGGAFHEATLQRFTQTAERAAAAGLVVNAGHDLNLANLPAFLAAVPGVEEVTIGHALVADALRYGLPETVRRYLDAVA